MSPWLQIPDPNSRRQPEWHLVTVVYGADADDPLVHSGAVQECVYLVKATKALEAFRRALELSNLRQSLPGKPDALVRLGITEVMPVWEPFEDGSELGYRDYETEDVASMREFILSEEEIVDR